MILNWGVALAPALVAAVLLVVPGLIVNLGVGARGFDALGLAPLASLGVLAIGTLMVPVVAGRWSLAAVSISLVTADLGRSVGARRHRVVDRWQGSRSTGLRSGRLGSMGHRAFATRWWMPRRRTVWWLASAGLAAAVVGTNFVLGVRDPNLPSQTIDAGFHYNAVLAVIRTGLPDGGQVGAASGAAVTAWYPPLWHDLTALVST